MIERDLRKIVTKRWDGWLDWLEPRGAAGIGRPDTDLFVDGAIVPVELKTGLMVEADGTGAWFLPRKIRADQISWAQRFKNAGGLSLWMIADTPETIWLAHNLVDHRQNYKQFLFEKAMRIDELKLSEHIREFVAELRRN